MLTTRALACCAATVFSSDFGVIPFIPPSWGGVDATPSTNSTDKGVNVSVSAAEVTVLAFSGPRELGSGAAQRFLYDVASTPSKPLNLTRHFEQRYLQVRLPPAPSAPPP